MPIPILRPLGRLRALAAITLVIAAAAAGPAVQAADAYPSKPITMVVGFPPGGSNDIVARIVAPALGQVLGVTVVVENRPGANATLGTDHVVRSAPDGYTITLGSASPLAISPHTYPKLPFDVQKDLKGVTTVAATSELVAMHPSSGVKTLAELVALARQRDVTLASSGNGGLPHLAIELLKQESKGRIVHVPYKGAGPAVTDAMGGHVDGVVMDLPALLAGVKDGRLQPIVATDRKRSATRPDVPDSTEAGMPGLIALNWFAVMAPARTPQAVVDRLYAALKQTLARPDVVEQLRRQGIEPYLQDSPQAFEAFYRDELVRWGEIARASGAKVDQ